MTNHTEKELISMFHIQSVRIVNHHMTGLSFSPLLSFAYDDTFCKSVGLGESQPILRSWVHRHTIVLGIQDSKLPFLEDGIQFLNEHGYDVIIRNSGGLAVVLDEGILNLSLIMKDEKTLSIDRAFEKMVFLIKEALNDITKQVVVKEIAGSYCPGKYDLSIDGKKFAGISQRRIQGGVAVQIYLCASHSGAKRAHLIEQFYRHSIKNEKTRIVYPEIQPETMASLAELTNTELTVTDLYQLVIKALKAKSTEISEKTTLSQQEITWFNEYQQRIIERNKKIIKKG